MLTPVRSSQFWRDVKRAEKRGRGVVAGEGMGSKLEDRIPTLRVVMVGLDPTIHLPRMGPWILGSRPRMTRKHAGSPSAASQFR